MDKVWKKLALFQRTAVAIRKEELEVRFLNGVLRCDPVVIQECLQNGIDPNLHSGDHYTALHMAAENDNIKLITILLQYRDTNINKQTNFGTTPLLLAVKTNKFNATELLLRRGAKVEMEDKNGYRAIHYACLLHHLKIVKLLLQYHVKVNVFNVFGKTPLFLVTVDNPSKVIAKLLLENGAVISLHSMLTMPIFLECALTCESKKHEDMIAFLLSEGVDINIIEPKLYRTALHMTGLTGYERLTKYLLNKGANKHLTDYRGHTAADLAKLFGNKHIVQLLEKHENTLN